jgi:hypothetical protein
MVEGIMLWKKLLDVSSQLLDGMVRRTTGIEEVWMWFVLARREGSCGRWEM